MMWDLNGHSGPPVPPTGMPVPSFPIPTQAPVGGHGPAGHPVSYAPSMPLGMQHGPTMPSANIPYAPQQPRASNHKQEPRTLHHTTHPAKHRKQHSSHTHHHHHHSHPPPPPPAEFRAHVTQPPPPQHPQFQYSKCTGRKKALCIGINYRGQRNELRGCINDARHVKKFLIQKHGYKEGDIVILTDDANNPRQQPTRKNIIDAMHWLVRSARPHDSLFFHYSGHGGQTPDLDGDEVDGFDEVIFPVDFQKHGQIIDDEMHSIMVKPLPPGCRLTALFDSCHSGTVLDLPFIYSPHGRLKGSHISNRARKRKQTPGDVISWSGCKDGQTSADTFSGGVAVGAMSYAFIESLNNNPNQSYQEFLKSVRHILYPKYSQRPQLGSSHQIDTNLRFII